MKQIKTLATLFLLTALIVFSGCKKDEAETIEKWDRWNMGVG
jgi:uncharacterized lipoprotein YajG